MNIYEKLLDAVRIKMLRASARCESAARWLRENGNRAVTTQERSASSEDVKRLEQLFKVYAGRIVEILTRLDAQDVLLRTSRSEYQALNERLKLLSDRVAKHADASYELAKGVGLLGEQGQRFAESVLKMRDEMLVHADITEARQRNGGAYPLLRAKGSDFAVMTRADADRLDLPICKESVELATNATCDATT